MEIASEDWIDAQQVSCERNELLREDEDTSDYGLVLSIREDELIVDTNEHGTLVATEWVTLDQAGLQPQLGDFDEDSPEAAGLEIIEAALDRRAWDETFFADEYIDLEAFSRDDEQLVYSSEEFLERVSDSSDPEQGSVDYSIEIYLANHAPRTQTLEEYAQEFEWAEPLAEWLRNRYPDQEMVFFWGLDRKPDGGEFLPVGPGRFLLIETVEGWKVLSVV